MSDTLRVVYAKSGTKVFLNDTHLRNLTNFEVAHTWDDHDNTVHLALRGVNVLVEHIPDFVMQEEEG